MNNFFLRLTVSSAFSFVFILALCQPQAQAQALMSHATVDVSSQTWDYTVFNDEPGNSTNFDGYFTLFVQAPIVVTGTPAGWAFTTDGTSFVNWYNTDPALPYPHDIAPGASLAGFTITSSVSSSSLEQYSIASWDHTADAPGPDTDGTVLAPSAPPAVPEASTSISFGSLLVLGSLGLAARKRARRRA